jgi:hypothetical protein
MDDVATTQDRRRGETIDTTQEKDDDQINRNGNKQATQDECREGTVRHNGEANTG